MMNDYEVENFAAEIPVDEYIAGFRDEERFLELCKRCRNYGNCWGCPPFDFDAGAFLRRYSRAHLMASKITPRQKDLPFGDAQKLILPERLRIERELLEMEKQYGGRSFAYIGKCLHCPDGKCVRPQGKPCLHPEKARPSLEAFGFDIAKTLRELFSIELLWGKEGKIPEYLVLVSGFFHNCDHIEF